MFGLPDPVEEAKTCRGIRLRMAMERKKALPVKERSVSRRAMTASGGRPPMKMPGLAPGFDIDGNRRKEEERKQLILERSRRIKEFTAKIHNGTFRRRPMTVQGSIRSTKESNQNYSYLEEEDVYDRKQGEFEEEEDDDYSSRQWN